METWRKSFVDRNMVLKIIIFNLVIFALVYFWEVINGLPLTKNGLEPELSDSKVFHPVNWLALEGSFTTFFKKPWTIFTYMFLHERVLSFLPLTIWLYTFGNLFQMLIGQKRLLPLYLFGGVAGGVIYLTASAFFHSNYYTLSASIPVVTIAAAITAFAPHYKIFKSVNGGFSLWILSLLYFLLTCISISSWPNFFAHAAGIAFGYAFCKQLKNGHDITKWVVDVAHKINHQFQPGAHQKTFVSQEKLLDEILDKISSKGMQSLTREEKKFLETHTK